ncbi:hypothetical protein CMV_028578 [Castanea mollissima]|uniref:Uncharacterized protein n=1 Tax=Castanea mollissima TaxID=60419 RepID=A0A8J4Q895_9ROSI|nr:hypothetical protein CMV_028578 [Castanea mollissima]
MATILRVLSISSQRGLTLTSMPQFLVPNSRIKSALDSEDTSALKSFGDSWESLVISLRSSSPQKAHLVLEWRLEKILEENVRDHDSFSELMYLCGKVI